MSATTTAGAKSAPNQATGPDIADWRPEDDAFWNSTGKRIAYRNLWISVPALFLAFAIWQVWSVVADDQSHDLVRSTKNGLSLFISELAKHTNASPCRHKLL